MSAAWRLRFQRELTDETLAIVRGYAEKVVAKYHQVEGITDERAAHDLVNQAVVDTLRGIRTWDPDREPPPGGLPLYRHLCRVVYSRAYHDRHRRKRQRSVSYHEVNLDAEESMDNVVEAQMSLQRDDARKHADYEAMLREMRIKLYAAARDAAGDDEEVQRYINLLERGMREGEMRREAGWDENAFNRIRRRYLTVVENLPARLLRDAREALARAPVRVVVGAAKGYRAQLALGDDLRKPKGTEIGAKDHDDIEDDDAPLYGDDDDHDDDGADSDSGDHASEEERDDG